MHNELIAEMVHAITVIQPQNITGAITPSLWIDMSKCRRLLFAIMQGAWAGGTPALTVLQAKDNAGTGSKALNIDRYWQTPAIVQSSTVNTDIPTETGSLNTNSLNLPATANVMTLIEVMATFLDFNNGFTHVSISVASPGANADYLSALAIAGDLNIGDFYPTNQLSVLG